MKYSQLSKLLLKLSKMRKEKGNLSIAASIEAHNFYICYHYLDREDWKKKKT